MADSWWDNVKDFAYRNAPEWVQERINDRALINNEASEREYARGAIENSQRWPHRDAGKEQVEVREGRSDEVLRRYSEAIRSGQTQAEPTITKATELENYRQEQAYHRKHNQTRGEVADTLDRAASARHRASWYDPGSEQREMAVDHARNLIDHARNVREGSDPQQQVHQHQRGADDARWEKTKQDMGFRSREDGPAPWVEPPLNLKDYARQMFEQRPITDRGWVAVDLDQAARARQSGDLGGARHFVEQARLDRIPYLSQDRGISR